MTSVDQRLQRILDKKAAMSSRQEKPAISSPGDKMLSIEQSINIAIQHHAANRLSQAAGIYTEILEADPDQPVALHLLGEIAYKLGKYSIAVDLLTKALTNKPDYADAYSNLGNVFRKLGMLNEAVENYHAAVSIEPDHVDAHINLGISLKELARLDEAVASYHNALAIKPDHVGALNNLGIAFKELGKLDEAVASFQKALVIKPGYANAHYNLGNACKESGRLEEAVASYLEALALKPDHVDAHNNLGIALKEIGKLDEAVASYHNALAIKPDFAEAYINLGVVFKELGNLEEVVASYHKALAIKPDHAGAHYNLGNAFRELGKLDDAVASYNEALAVNPVYFDALYNLGNAFKELWKMDEAVEIYHKALALKPDHLDTHNNLGIALKELGKPDEAMAKYHKALAIKSDFAEAHYNLGDLQLMTGDFQNGWENNAWRHQVKDLRLRPREYDKPFWDGGDLGGKTIFIYPEQGLGDFIQFIRYISLVAKKGGRVVVEVPKALHCLFSLLEGADKVIKNGQPSGHFDFHTPLLDLPKILGTTLQTVPAKESYLEAPSELIEKWKRKLSIYGGIHVGIIWGGNPNQKEDKKRSMDPILFKALLKITGVTFFSLQAGRVGEAMETFGPQVIDLMPEAVPFDDKAAVMMNLDLIISVDTSSAHLAGALGRPVWTLLSFVPHWRWMLERDDSPWYPTMRLIRQKKCFAWEGVIREVCQNLEEQLGNIQV